VFNSGLVAKAMRASMSFPVFFEPVVEYGMCLVDGGLFDNMPVGIARSEGFKNVMAIDVNRFTNQSVDGLKSGPEIFFRSMESVLHTLQEARKEQADLTINVYDDATPLSFLKKREFIGLGEHAVRSNMKALKDFFRPHIGLFRKPVVCGS